jgi:septal ring-binding cell division protein DamX
MQTPPAVEAAGPPPPAPGAGAAPSPPPSTSGPALVAAAPSSASTTGTDAVKQGPAVPAAPVPPTGARLTQERFAATQQWLRTAPTGHFTIQLLTVSANEIAVMERFLRQASELVDANDMRVYSVKLSGQQYYSATYGLYPSLEETITAMGDLPSSFKARGPYHRSVTLMRRQNQE